MKKKTYFCPCKSQQSGIACPNVSIFKVFIGNGGTDGLNEWARRWQKYTITHIQRSKIKQRK